MVLAWLVYGALVAVLVGIAASAAERVARWLGWPTRWIWAGSMVVSLVVPAWAILGRGPAAADAGLVPGAALRLSPLMVEAGSAAPVAGVEIDTLVLLGWIAVSTLLVTCLAVSAARLRRLLESARRAKVDGVGVLVSPTLGPAAVGAARGRIVLPEWGLELERRLRRLMLVHEAEHVRQGDPRLALSALALCALLPWNLALWWQLARLRLAIEMDCDARVLRGLRDRSVYGRLLIEMARRRARPQPLAVGFSPSTGLERRICRMTEGSVRGRSAVGAGSVAMLALVVACEAPSPEGVTVDDGTPDFQAAVELREEAPTVRSEIPDPPRSVDTSTPHFTPFDQEPRLLDVDELVGALRSAYPAPLKEAGVGGTATVWFLIGEDGAVRRTILNQSAGHGALDDAALRVARRMRFDPARLDGEVVSVWVSLPITFRPGDDPSRDPRGQGPQG